MIRKNKSSAPAGFGRQAGSGADARFEQCLHTKITTAPVQVQLAGEVAEVNLRKTLMAEIRCGRVSAQLVKLHFDFVGIALKHRLINVHQAMVELHGRGCLPYLFQEKGDT